MSVKNEEITLTGVALSKGSTIGKARVMIENSNLNTPLEKVDPSEKDNELKRLTKACKKVEQQLNELQEKVTAQIGAAEGNIFVAQKMILQDPIMLKEIEALITDHSYSARAAVILIFKGYEDIFKSITDSYMRERASDITDIKQRLINALPDEEKMEMSCCGDQKGPRIIVARELTPGLTLGMDSEKVLAFVTESGGINSHAAILARALNIPAISGVKDIHKLTACNDEILVNGETGEVHIHPSNERLRTMTRNRFRAKPISMGPQKGLTVMSSVASSHDLPVAQRMKAEGIGLYRTEFDFIAADRLLLPDELLVHYRAASSAFPDQPVYFRMADFGGDKQASFLNLPKEPNPFLGLRGSRLLLQREQLFKVQAEAFGRLSEERELHVMFPMVVCSSQFIKLKKKFLSLISNKSPNIKFGLVFEIPSACLDAEALLEEADFASIGTNDLTQYLFAVDRDNVLVSCEYDPGHPVLWQLVTKLCEVAEAKGKPLSLCGDVACSKQHLSKILKSGITSISVPPGAISSVRESYMQLKK